MNIILIGNGFDLAHGLPTTYTDFLTFLKRINTPPVKPTNFNPDLELLINDPENLDIIEKMRKLFLNNVWYNYFREKTITNHNWCDFEAEIGYVVKQLETIKNYLDEYRFLRLTNIDSLRINTTFLIISIIEYCQKHSFQPNLREIKILDNNRCWFNNKQKLIDLTIGINESNFNFDLQIIQSGPLDIAFENLITFILEQLEDFSKSFELYLSKFVNKLSYPKIGFINKLLSKHDNKILTFNNTNTPSRYNFPIIGDNICFIHGYACWNENDNLVLGIDEKNTTIDPMFAHFRKYFQRASKECNKNFRKWINDIKLRFRTDSAYYNPNLKHNLYIIGHSLTLSDRFILNELITLQNMTTTIYYHSNNNKINLMKNLAAILGYQKFSDLIENDFIKFEEGSFNRKIQEIKLD